MRAPFISEEVYAKEGVGSHFASLGLAKTSRPCTRTFLNLARCAHDIEKNTIAGAITTDGLARNLPKRQEILVTDDPPYAFYYLHNGLVAISRASPPVTTVHPSAIVHPTSFVAPRGVAIGAGVFIEPHVTILEGVQIVMTSVVRCAARIGFEDCEHKCTSRGIISVRHEGRVEIENEVETGLNNTVAVGLMRRDARIGCR